MYCLEQCDHDTPLFTLRLPDDAALGEEPCELVPGGVTITAEGVAEEADALYDFEPPAARPCRLRFVPFTLWAHREVGAMQVWVPRA